MKGILWSNLSNEGFFWWETQALLSWEHFLHCFFLSGKRELENIFDQYLQSIYATFLLMQRRFFVILMFFFYKKKLFFVEVLLYIRQLNKQIEN